MFVLSFQNISVAYSLQLSGFVRDKLTGEVLIGANVVCKQQNIGVSTDNRGYFSVSISTPSVISVSYTGYYTTSIELNMKNDSLIIVDMFSDNKLSEITVTGNAKKKYGVTTLHAKELTLLPVLGGKPDIIKALQLQPGVHAPSEGMSLMIVRGGEPGQNQYLLDNVPLIYVNHMGGLFSVFNPDMINTIDFYKGNFPARHGGKLSSIVDITQREGDKSKHQGSFSLGITDASLTFEGPLSSKSSYIVTARKTLIDALFASYTAISTAASYNQIVSYGFHDLNAKITHRANEKNSFSFNFYHGDDYYNMWKKPWVKPKNEPFHIYQKWGNLLMSARWNRSINPLLYTENILSFTRYRNKSGSKFEFFNADTLYNSTQNVQKASVNDITIRSNTKYNISNNWNVEFGGKVGYAFFEPYHNTKIIDKLNSKTIGQTYHTIESALFVDNKIKMGANFILQPSVRIAHYFNNNENFVIPEPRLNFTFLMNDNHRFNVNFMQVSQSAHLIYTPSFIFKSEVWLPSSSSLPPEVAKQLSVSWFGNIRDDKYSLETNVFYKKMKHLVTLKEEYENMLEITGIENKIANNGNGTSYGIECMIRKNYGKWTGSAAYSWIYADRQFENVNFGNAYEYDFNRAHNIVINANRELNKKWNFNFVWLLQSGAPLTPALAKVNAYNPETKSVEVELIYGTKNSARLQAYHRLDIGLNHTITTKKGNKAIWTYSIYNLYNNINPYTSYYANNDDYMKIMNYSKPLKHYKYGFFTIIPSIAYKVYFDFDKSKPKPEKPQKSEKRKFNWLYLE